MKAMTFKEFKAVLASRDLKSIKFRELGGNKVEVITVIRGSVTRHGFIKLD